MSLEWEQTIVDSRDPAALGGWWCDALGWVVVNEDPDEFEIRPSPERLPGLLFVPVPEAKLSKNRLHLDFRPDDRDAEVERLLALGPPAPTSAKASSRGSCSPILRATNSAYSVRALLLLSDPTLEDTGSGSPRSAFGDAFGTRGLRPERCRFGGGFVRGMRPLH